MLHVEYMYVFPASWACEGGRKRSSLTLNGVHGHKLGCQCHVLSSDSVFLFLLDSATVFPPSHPLVSYCLEFSRSVLMFGNFFCLLLTPMLLTILFLNLISSMFSPSWPAHLQIIRTKGNVCIRKEKRVELSQEWFGATTWPPFYCFQTPLWLRCCHVKN